MALHTLGLPETAWVRGVLAMLLVALGGLLTVLALVRWHGSSGRCARAHPPGVQPGYVLPAAVVVGPVLLAAAFW